MQYHFLKPCDHGNIGYAVQKQIPPACNSELFLAFTPAAGHVPGTFARVHML